MKGESLQLPEKTSGPLSERLPFLSSQSAHYRSPDAGDDSKFVDSHKPHLRHSSSECSHSTVDRSIPLSNFSLSRSVNNEKSAAQLLAPTSEILPFSALNNALALSIHMQENAQEDASLQYSDASKVIVSNTHDPLHDNHSMMQQHSHGEISVEPQSISTVGQRENPSQRIVYINNPQKTNQKYDVSGNRIHTSKYTWYSFIPRNVFEQFHRVAYIYFLIILILNQIPQLAVFGKTASLFPLLFVLLVTAIKDGFEDWGRHKSDRVENNRVAFVLDKNHFAPKKWERVRVGEMVKVHANESVPCDIVLLATSDPSGVAYIQTTNIDGESNLKTRYAHQATSKEHPELRPIVGTLFCEQPNRNIYGFSAYLDLENTRLSLGPINIILRGCELKNTSWVVGVVVYAGQETKAMLNSSGAQSKRSKLERQMNRETLWLSFFLLIICLIGGVGMGLWVGRHDSKLDTFPFYQKKDMNGENYLFYGPVGEGLLAFLGCVILFQIMIPISLYISMELVRLGQAFFMVRDKNMFHSESNSYLKCRALNINEDLGQIGYVFSDKTGTLTENKMEFHSATINGTNYNNAKGQHASINKFTAQISSVDLDFDKVDAGKQSRALKVGAKVDPDLVQLLQDSTNAEEKNAVHNFLLVLAVCNTVVPTWVNKSSSGQLEMQIASAGEIAPGFIDYHGESPDEQALVSAAADYGYRLLERTSSSVVIDVLGNVQR
ncbi:hypothetical protein O6H91_12G034100 [Diphasiastrum complanatum]|nr:hypothetical protein O6H91_12G034100 [Diphasiastrum complanatum]